MHSLHWCHVLEGNSSFPGLQQASLHQAGAVEGERGDPTDSKSCWDGCLNVKPKSKCLQKGRETKLSNPQLPSYPLRRLSPEDMEVVWGSPTSPRWGCVGYGMGHPGSGPDLPQSSCRWAWWKPHPLELLPQWKEPFHELQDTWKLVLFHVS